MLSKRTECQIFVRGMSFDVADCMKNASEFGSLPKSIFFSLLFVLFLWLVQWAHLLLPFEIHELGVLPKTLEGLKGIVLMPFVHAEDDLHHLINNSLPLLVLLASLFYFYRPIAWKVLVFGWLLTGLFLWAYAKNKGAYHIGASGVIYFLASFLFTSGLLRKYLPLQAISLFVVFAYGSMLWGILPLKEKVSWEGHFAGFSVGLVLAFVFREEGPQRPKYQYEIEKEMGIEPPDLEAAWNEKVRLAKQKEEDMERRKQGFYIVYHYRPTENVHSTQKSLHTASIGPKSNALNDISSEETGETKNDSIS
jgi:membrane associated rhomboid family serine protease